MLNAIDREMEAEACRRFIQQGRLMRRTGLCRYKHMQTCKEEERAKAFERVFNDPDVDLEEVAAQVDLSRALKSSLMSQ